jgi:hypothetical protein
MKKIISAHDKDNVLNFFAQLGPAWQSRFFSPEITVPGYTYDEVIVVLQQFEKFGLIDKAVYSLGGFVDFRITLEAYDFVRRGGFVVQEIALQKTLDELLDDLTNFRAQLSQSDTAAWDLLVKVEKFSLLLSKSIPLTV